MSDSEDRIDSLDEAGEDDLFGDGDDDQLSDHNRAASDHGRESDREDGNLYGDEDADREGVEQERKTKYVMGVQLYRHRIPRPKDGAVSCSKPQRWIRGHVTA